VHPVLFQLPWGPANAYGTMILLGGISCMPLIAWDARQRRIAPGQLGSFVIDFYLVLVFGAAIGGRVLHLVTLPGDLLTNLSRAFALDAGGFVFFGSLLAIVAGWAWLARRYDTRFSALCDLGATFIPLGHGFGRLGCFLAGCCFGAPTSGAFAVSFPPDSIAARTGEVPLHGASTIPLIPVQLVEAIALFALFGVMIALRLRNGPHAPPFRTTSTYLLGYGIIRAATEIVRGDLSRGFVFETTIPWLTAWLHLPPGHPVALSVSQAFAAAMVVAGLVGLRMTRVRAQDDASVVHHPIPELSSATKFPGP